MIACPDVEPHTQTRNFKPPSEKIKVKKKKPPPTPNIDPALATTTVQNVAFAAGANGGGGGEILPHPLLTQMKVQVQRRGGGRILAYTIIWRVLNYSKN